MVTYRRHCGGCSVNALCGSAYLHRVEGGYGCQWLDASLYAIHINSILPDDSITISLRLSAEEWKLLSDSRLPGQSVHDVIHDAILNYCMTHTSIFISNTAEVLSEQRTENKQHIRIGVKD